MPFLPGSGFFGPRHTPAHISATVAGTMTLTAARQTGLQHAIAAACALALAPGAALATVRAGACALALQSSSLVGRQLGATLALASALGSSLLGHTVDATLTMRLNQLIATATGATLAAALGVQASLAHASAASLTLRERTNVRIAHTLSALLTLSSVTGRGLFGIVRSSLPLALNTAPTTLRHALGSALSLTASTTAALAHQIGALLELAAVQFRPALRAALTAAPRTRRRPLAYSAPLRLVSYAVPARPLAYAAPARTIALRAAWRNQALIATPIRIDGATPYVSPLETNVSFSVDLSDALGALTLSHAALVGAKSRAPDQSDAQAVAMSTFVSSVITGSNAFVLVCGDATQQEDQDIEVTVALTLNTTPTATWTCYVELPVRKGAPT